MIWGFWRKRNTSLAKRLEMASGETACQCRPGCPAKIPGPVDLADVEAGIVPAFEEKSPTWLWMKKELTSRIDRLRQQNDAPGLNSEETAYLRGRIKACQDLLDMPKEMEIARNLRDSRPDPAQFLAGYGVKSWM